VNSRAEAGLRKRKSKSKQMKKQDSEVAQPRDKELLYDHQNT
jgi:hypothetical protein